MISYEPLWKTMEERGISQYRLLKSGLDNKTLDSLKKGQKHHCAHYGKAVQDTKLHAE